MKRTIVAATTALALTFLAVAAAFAWQSRIEGRPASFQAGSSSGVYFWHDPDGGLYLRTTDPQGQEHWYTGEIYSNGTMRDLDRVLLEPQQGDSASIGCAGHCITFQFHTFSGIDGIDYFIGGGTYQTLSLQRDGALLSVDNIYLGEDSVHPDHNPFMVCRDDNDCY